MNFRLILLAVLTAGVMGAATVQAQVSSNSVTVHWTTPGDDSLTGTATQFDLRYSTSAITAANFASATRVTTGVPAPSTPGTRQSAVVTGLAPSTAYWFAIKTADEVPNWAGISNIFQATTLAAPDVTRPAPLALTITGTTDSTATLGWTAVGDDSLTGTATTYDVRYSTSPITAANFASATAVTGVPAPAVSGTAQSVVVKGLGRQVTYWFAARVSDEVPNTSALSNVPSVTTPDTAAPAAVKDLAASFVWLGWNAALDVPHRSRVRG